MGERIDLQKLSVAPSVLPADFGILGEVLEKLEAAGADMVHFDVMDGQFVPNLTFGAPLIRSLRRRSRLPFDVHLMTETPERMIDDILQAGADMISFHVEAARHPHRVVQQIRAGGALAGIALNPGTPPVLADYLLPELDFILLLAVNPGFGGQKLIPQVVDKVRDVAKMLNSRGLSAGIEIDGGVNTETAGILRKAGASIFIAGSSVFGAEDMAEAIQQLRGRNTD